MAAKFTKLVYDNISQKEYKAIHEKYHSKLRTLNFDRGDSFSISYNPNTKQCIMEMSSAQAEANIIELKKLTEISKFAPTEDKVVAEKDSGIGRPSYEKK